MKKIMILSFAALILAGCTRGSIVAEQVSGKVFHATFSDECKTCFDETFNPVWSAGDRISVFSGSTNQQYEFQGKDGDNTGSFSKVTGGAASRDYSSYYAVYPYNSSNASASEGTLNISLPAVQNAAVDRYLSGSNTMVAVTADLDDDNLKFRNVCGYLKVMLYCNTGAVIKSLTLTGNNGESLCGAATVTASSAQEPSVTVTSGEKTITLDCGEGIEIGRTAQTATPFYFAVPPTTFSAGFTVTASDTDKCTFTQSTSSSVSIGRNRIRPMEALLYNPVAMEINGTVIHKTSNIYGLITDKATGQAIADVPVSDGFKYVRTDEHGVYQMTANPNCRTVFYSLPADCKTVLDENHRVKFWYNDLNLEEGNRRDFVLEKIAPQNEWTLAVFGDIHIGYTNNGNAARFRDKLSGETCKVFDREIAAGNFKNVYMFEVGDMAHTNADSEWNDYYSVTKDIKLSNGSYVPFYQCIGNHDRMNTGSSDPYVQQEKYTAHFGPVDYSYNIGDAHVIVMDTSQKMLLEAQFNWLLADLAQVENKADKLCIFCGHAPFRDGKEFDGSTNMGAYRADILSALTQFHQVHMMDGHTHRATEWVHDDYKTKGGWPILEHIHGQGCGHYYQSTLTADGTPFGATYYTVRGNEVVNYELGAVDHGFDYQLAVYDGDQEIVNGKGHTWYWYNSANTWSSRTAIGSPVLKNSFVVDVFKANTADWKVELWKDGVKVADLQRVPESICNVFSAAWYEGNGVTSWKVDHVTRSPQDRQHLFYYHVPDGKPSEMTGWTVKAIHTVPSSENRVNTYECSTFTRDFTGYLWQ